MNLTLELTNLYHFLFDFLIMTIGVKMLLAHWIVDQGEAWWKATFQKNEYHQAILTHYTKNALHDGHDTESIVNCQQGMCAQIY